MKKQIKKGLFYAVILNFFVISMVFSDGLIVITHYPQPRPRSIPSASIYLDVINHDVDVQIKGQKAVTSIDQTFHNQTGYRLEGTYLFPIPKNAVIKKFSMFIDGKEVQAELLSADKARKIYEDIVRQMKDPALLEYQDTGLFRVKIFPIEPYADKRVKISYTEILEQDNKTIEYVYPLNTEKFSSVPLKKVSVHVTVESAEKIKNIYCPTHDAEIIRKGENRAEVSYEKQNIKPDRDFRLYFQSDKRSSIGLSLLTYKKTDEEGYFFLSLAPDQNISKEEIEEKDITFALDVSGSMAGDKLKQAKKALLFCIENLNKGDKFEIIRFSTEAEPLFKKLTDANSGNIKKAKEFIEDLQAIGGTNIEEALQLALSSANKNRTHIIVFITDGKPTIGETDENGLLDKIKKYNNEKTRIFTFGIGDEINTHLLDKITELAHAYRSYITPDEDIEIKISNFYQKIQSPVLTGLKIKVIGNVDILKFYPMEIPDLFKGSSLTILGKYKGSGKTTIVLEGMSGNKKKAFEYETDFSSGKDDNDFIPSLWASRRIGYLLDQVRLHGKEQELIDEITSLAKTYGIITPYTSFLILEDEKNQVSRDQMAPQDRTLSAVIPQSSDFNKRSEEEYHSMKEKSGKAGVKSSRDLQNMAGADNYEMSQPGQSKMNYKDKENKTQNITSQIKYIKGRAFYHSDNFWVDSKIQSAKPGKTEKIKFGSEEYFSLIKNVPETVSFLALGQNVRFILNNILYEISE